MSPRLRITTIVDQIEQLVDINCQPTHISKLIKQAIIAATERKLLEEEVAEQSERVKAKVIKEIRKRQIETSEDPFGYFYDITLSDVNEEILVGSCFTFKSDPEEVLDSKTKRSKYAATSKTINNLTFDEFEEFCGYFLKVLGVEIPIVSRASNDQGIDFYGLWEHKNYLQNSALSNGMEKQLRTWIFGQAKKYDRTGISTAQIRELVGSVLLAKTKTFSSKVPEYDFDIRPCDPVFHFFITTGKTTSGVRKLMTDSGVIFLDSVLMAIFLCDRVPDLHLHIDTKEMLLNHLKGL